MSEIKPEVTVPTDQPPSYAPEADDIELGDGDEAPFVVDLVGVR